MEMIDVKSRKFTPGINISEHPLLCKSPLSDGEHDLGRKVKVLHC